MKHYSGNEIESKIETVGHNCDNDKFRRWLCEKDFNTANEIEKKKSKKKTQMLKIIKVLQAISESLDLSGLNP